MRDVRGSTLLALGFLIVQLAFCQFKLTYAPESPEWTAYLTPTFVYLLVAVIQIYGDRQDMPAASPSSLIGGGGVVSSPSSSGSTALPLIASTNSLGVSPLAKPDDLSLDGAAGVGGATASGVAGSSSAAVAAGGGIELDAAVDAHFRSKWSDLSVYSLYGALPCMILYLNFGPMYGFLMIIPAVWLSVNHYWLLRNAFSPSWWPSQLPSPPFPVVGTALFSAWACVGALKLGGQLSSFSWWLVVLALVCWLALLCSQVPAAVLLRKLEVMPHVTSAGSLSVPPSWSTFNLSDMPELPPLEPKASLQGLLFVVLFLPVTLSAVVAASQTWQDATAYTASRLASPLVSPLPTPPSSTAVFFVFAPLIFSASVALWYLMRWTRGSVTDFKKEYFKNCEGPSYAPLAAAV